MININDETKIIKDLEEEYEFGKTGWKTVPNIKTFKASPYKIFDNVVPIIFSLK